MTGGDDERDGLSRGPEPGRLRIVHRGDGIAAPAARARTPVSVKWPAMREVVEQLAVVAGVSLHEACNFFEREYVSTVLELHKGRVGEAALALGIRRTNLYRKMRALAIPVPGSPAHRERPETAVRRPE